MNQTIYPIGIQNFEKIRKDGYLYIDKTALVYQLVTTGQYYFLSRPPTLREKPVAVHAGGLFPREKRSCSRDWPWRNWKRTGKNTRSSILT